MKIKVLVILAVIIGLSLISFWLGGYLATNRMSKSVEEIQAKLAFTHMRTYNDIRSYIISNCNDQAIERLSFAMDEQLMLMAEFFQFNNTVEFEDYVNLRQPGLVSELKSLKVDWEKPLIIDNCEKAIHK